jgi:two-component system OmpR family response regulator
MANILLVEDDRWLADCFSVWLAADDHTVRHVTDAHDAMDAIDDSGCDVIILDLLLSYTNGIQLLHTLQSYPDLADVPVVICSASAPANAQVFAMYGVRQVLDKTTLTPVKLRSAIKKVLAHAAV